MLPGHAIQTVESIWQNLNRYIEDTNNETSVWNNVIKEQNNKVKLNTKQWKIQHVRYKLTDYVFWWVLNIAVLFWYG